MKVAEIMTLHPQPITAGASMDEALTLMDQHDVRHLPVVDEGGRLVGVVSDRDLLAATGWLPARVHAARGPHGADALPAAVRDIQHAPVVTVGPRDDVVQAAVELLGRKIGCLPVVDGTELVGIVTEMDVIRSFVERLRAGTLPSVVDPTVEGHMSEHPTTLAGTSTLEEAAAAMRANDVRHLPVMENGELAGIVSDRDLRRAWGCGRPADLAVEEVMVREPQTVPPDTPMSEAARKMAERKISALPVVQDDELVGILTITDLIEHCMGVMRDPVRSLGA